MKLSLRITLLSSLFAIMVGCGGTGTEDPNQNPDAPVLSPIGNKTVTTGNNLAFTISATDPNGLLLTYDSDGGVGGGPNPYSDTGNTANFNPNTRQFSWNTIGVALGDYNVQFSVMNSAGHSDSETIRIRIQAEPPSSDQYTTGQTLYNNSCRDSNCHNNEDIDPPSGGKFSVLCLTEAEVKNITENPPRGMPPFNFNSTEEAAISYYLTNVHPDACLIPTP
ncbi:MAG: hypothetical protein PVF82_05565 [Gammaproteobacteria bacterium]|jgi:hypothetical protein